MAQEALNAQAEMNNTDARLFVIGTELLKGQVADGHGKLISSELSRLGYNVKSIEILPDDGSVQTSMEACLSDTDLIIVTGGLGPTSDDMTRRAIAEVAGVELVLDQGAWDTLYKRVGERIHGANEQQAYIPKGFTVIENPLGTAPGFMGRAKGVLFIAMPGPPRELGPMFLERVLPFLTSLSGHESQGRDEYSVFLTPESKLEELCVKSSRPSCTWGDRFQSYRISLYLGGENRALMAKSLSDDLGPGLMVPGDLESWDLLEQALLERGLAISTAESLTGGLIAKLLTDRPGSSAYFKGSAVTYCNQAKEKVLGVPHSIIESYTEVSCQCAQAMAEGAMKLYDTDFAISTTGIAGPTGGTEQSPVGTVCLGFASRFQKSQSARLVFQSYGRDSIRRRSAVAAMLLGCFYLSGGSVIDMASAWQYI